MKPSFDEQLQNLSKQLEQLQSSAEKELNKAARDLGLDAGKTIKLESNPQNGFYFRLMLLFIIQYIYKYMFVLTKTAYMVF